MQLSSLKSGQAGYSNQGNKVKIAQTQCFRDLIDSGSVYVDKTEQIFRLLNTERTFIARPRRFGKTLMLDTIETLFEYGVDPCFRDTWIHDRWTEQTCPVLRLDFLKFGVSDYDGFAARFIGKIRSFAERLGLRGSIPDRSPGASLFTLFLELRTSGKRIVILIDDYDAPLSANSDNPELHDRFRKMLRDLQGIMKGDPCIRYLVMAGTSRWKDPSLFSDLTDFKDMTFYMPVSEIAGFTRNEIRKYYIHHLNLAVSLEKGIREDEVTDSDRDELLDRLGEEYGGYCFDSFYERKVFSTWSVNSFFRDVMKNRKVVFGDYLGCSGSVPSFPDGFPGSLRRGSDGSFQDIDVRMTDFWYRQSLRETKPEVLLCDAGYLTVHSPVPDGGSVTLGVPNREMQRVLEKALSAAVSRDAGQPAGKPAAI